MVVESLEEYVVETSVEAYKDPWEQVPVAIMDPGREMKNVAYSAPWIDQK